MNEVQRLREQGLDVESVGEIMDGREDPETFGPMLLPTMPDYPYPFVQPGIYFGMSDETYHAIPAVSCGGIKRFAWSPMGYWANCPWMNKAYEPQAEKEHNALGHAYHCRILEGPDVFNDRYVIGLDQTQFGDKLLVSTDDIKAEIARYRETPVTKVGTGEMVENLKRKKPEDPAEIELTRTAKKEDWINQLLRLDPDALIWGILEARFQQEHEGKLFIDLDQLKRIEFAAAMIERDPELCLALKNGWPEVSLFWFCPRTGLPKKARVDFLKIKAMVDLKTLANQQELSMERAIPLEVARRRYILQPCHYWEGGEAVRALVRAGDAAICVNSDVYGLERVGEITAWVNRWAEWREPDEWLWIFQQKGIAPVTRGVWFHRASTARMLGADICSDASKRIRTFAETYGTDAWLDTAPLFTLNDEDLPRFATEI